MILNEAINYLGVLFTAAVRPIPVFDGPKPPAVNNQQFVVVGSAGDDDDGAVLDLTPSTLGPGDWLDESGEIICSAWSWSGDTDVASRRAEALAAAGACVAAVQADRTLGGLLIDEATVGNLRYQAVQFKEGALVRASFSVTYLGLNT